MSSLLRAVAGLGVVGVAVFFFSARSSRSALSMSVPAADAAETVDVSKGADTAVFAGGCFWGIDAVFRHVKGVVSVTSGYSGGRAAGPSYEQVSTGETGHAESVRVIYDPGVVTYPQLLQVFFSVHDPEQLNRQGPDYGTQYRSAIFYTSDAQKRAAESYIAQLTREKVFKRPIVTQVAKFEKFWPAEEYHQNYLAQHPNQPYIMINDRPKVELVKARFGALWREQAL